MIKLDVADYCHSCLNFVAVVEKPVVTHCMDGSTTTLGNTIVSCEYRDQCARVAQNSDKRAKIQQAYHLLCQSRNEQDPTRVDKAIGYLGEVLDE